MRTPSLSAVLGLVAGAALAQAPQRAGSVQALSAAWDSVTVAWDAGRYDAALVRLERLLTAPGGERWLDSAALLTGELYRTITVAPDGWRALWSSDGRYAIYEVGPHRREREAATELAQPHEANHVIVLRPAGDSLVPVARLDGMVAAFLGTSGRVAYVSPGSERPRLLVRDLATGTDEEWPTPGLNIVSLADAGDARHVVVASRAVPDDSTRVDLYGVGPDGRLDSLAVGPGVKRPIAAAQGGALLVYTVGRYRVGVRAPWGGSRSYVGTGPTVTADRSLLVFVGVAEGEYALVVLPLRSSGSPTVIKRTALPLANPALSPDGRRVVFQMMPREDWELYLIGSDGSGEHRLTHEIQHDLLPEFLTNDLVLAKMGEQRHRRSYLYDLATGVRTRLFHNNTVRTVAPEYVWAPSPDGTRVMIIADRDGDTISPERGVYLTDLTRRVTLADVVARVRMSLATERELRARGRRMFGPIAAAVRALVAQVSVARIDRYAHDLFGFDSKFVTQPGNRLAMDYLAARLREFGYEPELQWFEPRPGVPSANVVATLRGTTNPELVYVVGSHFDSVEEGPGADDDASGTCALLETARALATHPLPATVQFVFYTGEEAGLRGSREFARRAVADGLRVVGALNNDMIGWMNDHRLDNTVRYSNDGLRDLQHAAAFLFTDLITYDSRYYQSTDAQSLFDAFGDIIAGIGSYPILGNPHYHEPHDVLETISQRLVAEVARTTIASVMLMASSPSRPTGLAATRRAAGVEVAWNPAAERGVTGYRVAHGPPEDPTRRVVVVRAPHAVLPDAGPGMSIAVRAIGARGLEGWDWARTIVP